MGPSPGVFYQLEIGEGRKISAKEIEESMARKKWNNMVSENQDKKMFQEGRYDLTD